jgi:CheY-like chemotaxis protein
MTQDMHQSTAKTILLVEDDADIRELLLRTFTIETDYEVLTMRSGAETIERLAEVLTLKPVLFILNYRLPTMTGLELYDILHAQPGLQNVPAIIISAFQLTKNIKRRLHARGITLLEKPFDLEDFLCYIEQTLLSQQSAIADIRDLLPGQEQ